ncbi:MAG TPA: cytochrome c-type biogenesis protein CcmH [Gemmatimonadales bacterium]|nr:cytochrome c-type biogenesis protein CcmH [Gemmatimonadales bacterium]
MTVRQRSATTRPSDRRVFLTLGVGALLGVLTAWRRAPQQPDSLPGGGAAGRLWDPARAGRPLDPVTAADNDATIQAIEKQIHCTCGCNQDVYTCRTTDFTCTTSPAMHRQVLALARAGKTGPEIIDAFVREHGIVILMAPPKRGFNLAGYFMPSLLIVVAGAILTVVLRRWSRDAALATPDAAPLAPAPGQAASPEEIERLRRELERLSR